LNDLFPARCNFGLLSRDEMKQRFSAFLDQPNGLSHPTLLSNDLRITSTQQQQTLRKSQIFMALIHRILPSPSLSLRQAGSLNI